MQAEDRLRAGDLEESLRDLQEQVRRQPAHAGYRVFLFQLLAVMGQWRRALNQLEVAGELDAGTLAMVQTYREVLRCEVLRAEVFAGRRSPLVFGTPAEWVALLMESQRLLARGAIEQARGLRERALEQAPTTSGTIDGARFEWIMDGDARLGPLLEVIISGRYYWVPFQRIHAIRLEQPADLRDLVWMPAQFTWTNQGEAVGFIPTRYPGSESSANPELRRAQRTEWQELPDGACLGLGQRMFFTDSGEYSLMDLRAVDLDSPPDEGPAAAGDALV